MTSDENTRYKVVMNDEEQYSIWAAERPIPAGWRDASKSGSKSECLAYIGEVWTDMRPLSLRSKSAMPAIALEHSALHLNGSSSKVNGNQ